MSDFISLTNPEETNGLKTYVVQFHPNPLPSTQLGVPLVPPTEPVPLLHGATLTTTLMDTPHSDTGLPDLRTNTANSVHEKGINGSRQWDSKHAQCKTGDLFSRYLSHVVANFSADLDEQYRPSSVPITRSILTDQPSMLGDTVAPKDFRKLQKTISFGKVPTMLLPKARPRVRQDLEDYLRSLGRSGHAVPLDHMTSLELSVFGESARDKESFQRFSGPRPLSVSSSVSSSSLQGAQPSAEEDYLENYSDVSSVLSWLHRNRRKRGQGGGGTGSSDPFKHVTCPDCRKLLMERGILDQTVRDWWKMARKNFQPLPKHNNVRRGVTPHFCNYVRSKALHDREPTAPSTSRLHTSQNRHNAYSRPTSTVSGHSTSGTEGRPASPNQQESDNDTETVEHEIEVPRIKVSRKYVTQPDVNPPTEPLKSRSDNEVTPITSDLKTPDRRYDHDRSKCSSKSAPKPYTDTKKHNVAEKNNAKENQQPKSGLHNSTSSPIPPPTAPDTPAPDSKPSKKGRRLVKKKEKKSVQRERRAKEDPADVVEDTVIQEKPSTPPPPEPEQHKPDLVPQAKEIEAPRPIPRVPPTKTNPVRRGSKSIISDPSGFFKPDITEILEQELKERRFYNFPIMSDHRPEMTQKPVSSNWTQGRLALSQQSSRFELPMDMKLLETMKPVEYLSRYCVVTSKRQWLYEKIYLKHKDTKLGGLNLKGLEKALKEALVDTITPEEVTEMIELVQITETSKIDQKLFVGIAAMTERLLYPRFLTEETQNIKEHKKEKIECADFCGLEWKFHGVNVNDNMKKLLESL